MAIFDIFHLVFLAVVSTKTSNAGCVCKNILASNANSPSGMYPVITASGHTIQVYCEMGLGDGGYTFLTPESLTKINDAELSTWFTNRTTFLLRVRKTDGTQPYAVLKQLAEYSSIPLKLGLSQYSGYNAPKNIFYNYLDNLFLYFGFLPIANASNNNVQGIMVNNYRNTFINCDGNPNSQFTLFPNFREAAPTNTNEDLTFSDQLFAHLLANPSQLSGEDAEATKKPITSQALRDSTSASNERYCRKQTSRFSKQ